MRTSIGHGRKAVIAGAVLCWLPAGAGSVEAQVPGTIHGSVVDAATQFPLAGGNVTVEGTGLGVTTDAQGRFLLRNVPAGGVQLTVSRIGYESERRELNLAAGETAQVTIALQPSAVLVDEIRATGRSAVTEIRESPFSVSVVEGQQLAGRGLTVDEALQRVTGVQVRRSGGLGSSSIFNIRGLEGKRVQIYVNGSAVDIAGDAFTLDDIPLQLVERVEVYKGVVPARFGGDGLGAAVNVVTIHPEGGYFDAGYTVGSYGQHQISLTGQRPLGRRAELAISVNLDRADNDYRMESPFTPGVVIRRDHDGFRRSLIGGSLEVFDTWFDVVELEAAYIGARQQLQGIQTNIRHAETHSGFGAFVLDAEKVAARGGRLDVKLGAIAARTRGGMTDTSTVRYHFDGRSYPSPNGRGELGQLPSESDNRTTFLRHRFVGTYRFTPLHTANLTYVLDHSSFRPSDPLANEYAGRNVSEFPGKQTSLVVGASHELRPFGDRLINVAGVRGYLLRSDGTPSNVMDPRAERPPSVRNSIATVGVSEAIRYRLTSELMAKGSVELARRLPSSTELFGDGLLVIAAPGLRPERSLNFNLGLQYDHQLPDGRRVQAEVGGFRMHLRDMIRMTQGYAGLAAHTNLGAARVTGADAEVRVDPTRWLHTAAGVTYQDVRDVLRLTPGTSVPNPTYGLRLPHMPWLFGNALVEVRGEDRLGRDTRTRLFSELLFTEEYFYAFELSRRQERRIPRSTTINVGLEQAWTKRGVTLSAELQNLMDGTVLNQFNQPLPGRTFRVKARYTWIGESTRPHRHGPR